MFLVLLGNNLNISGYSGLPIYDSDNTDFLPSEQADIMTDWMIKPLFGLGIKYKSNIDYLHRYRYLDQLWAFDTEALKVTYSTAAQAWKTIIRIKYNERGLCWWYTFFTMRMKMS